MKYYKIFGRPSCGWCCRACEVLNQKNLDFMFCDMEMSPDLLQYHKEIYDMKTVPIIVEIDLFSETERLIGGCTDLIKYLEESDD